MLYVFIHQVCRYDFVEVKDKDDQVLGKFCGGKIPQTVTSTSNLMWVEFRSDHTQSRGGFSAVYYAGNQADMLGTPFVMKISNFVLERIKLFLMNGKLPHCEMGVYIIHYCFNGPLLLGPSLG